MDGILEEKWSGVSSHWKYDVIPYSRLVRNGGECREIFGVSMKQAIHVPGIYMYIYPHLPVPYIMWNQVSSYLMYWQLGAWFQIHRELEDQGI